MLRKCYYLMLVLLLAGCEGERESGPSLTGQLTADGQPCKPVSVNDFDLKFVSVEGEGPTKRSYLAEVAPDGAFTVNGSIGRGIPVGRYKVSVVGSSLDAAGKRVAKHSPAINSKTGTLEVELTADSRELMVDLVQGTAEVR